MKIIDLIKEKINRIVLKRKHLLLNYNKDYEDSVNKIKEEIINSIPKNIENIEKAYFIYIELGKKLFENPINAFRF